MYDFNNKNIVITGSSSGIGYSIAKKFSDMGSSIIINGKNKKKLVDAKKNLNSKSDFIQANLLNKNEIDLFTKKVLKKFNNKVDILVCNLGSGKIQNDKNIKKNLFHSFNINFFNSVLIIDALKKTLKSRKGNILCMSSICGIETIEGAPIFYSVAKNALNFYVKTYSRVLAKDSIRINAIAPGNILFNGSTWDTKLKNDKRRTKKIISDRVPLNKFGTTNDIAELAIYLCSDKSSFVTGSIFTVDGGQTVSV